MLNFSHLAQAAKMYPKSAKECVYLPRKHLNFYFLASLGLSTSPLSTSSRSWSHLILTNEKKKMRNSHIHSLALEGLRLALFFFSNAFYSFLLPFSAAHSYAWAPSTSELVYKMSGYQPFSLGRLCVRATLNFSQQRNIDRRRRRRTRKTQK